MSVPAANATCSFANIPLPVWTPGWQGFTNARIPLREYAPFASADWYNSRDISHLPVPNQQDQPTTEVGTLRWPQGASRWAVAHFAVTLDKLADIRTALGLSGDPEAFVLDDGTGHDPVECDLFMLPPRPLAGQPAGTMSPLWLMTLVDERFYWWMKPVSISAVPSSWADLFGQISTALGITLQGDTSIEAEYLTPTERWLCSNVPACVLLDAAATSVGRQVVRLLDGTVRLELPTTARDLTNQSWQAARTPLTARPLGGTTSAGGRVDITDIARTVPAQLAVVFGKKVNGPNGTTVTGQYVSTVSGNAVGVYVPLPGSVTDSLTGSTVSAYPGIPGMVGRFTADAYAYWVGASTVGDPANKAALDALAAVAASAWYGWRYGDVDAVFAGEIAWRPDGYTDQVRWSFDAGETQTRVQRDGYFNWNVYGYFPLPLSGGGVASSAPVWAKVVEKVTTGHYKMSQVVLSGIPGTASGRWVTPANPLVVTAVRADSSDYNEPQLPDIDPGQQMQIYPSTTATGLYEMHAWGSEIMSRFKSIYDLAWACSGGSLIVSAIRQTTGPISRDQRYIRWPGGTDEANVLSSAGF